MIMSVQGNMFYKSKSVPHRLGSPLNRKMLGQVILQTELLLSSYNIRSKRKPYKSADILYIK